MYLVFDIDILQKHGVLIFLHLLHTVYLVQDIGESLPLQNRVQVGILPPLIDHPGAHGHIVPLGRLPLHGSLVLCFRLHYLLLLLCNLLLFQGDRLFLQADLFLLCRNLILLQADGGHCVGDLGIQVVDLLLQDILFALQRHNLVVNALKLICVLVDLSLYLGNTACLHPQAVPRPRTEKHTRQTQCQYEI